jgi:hypothetical protein
MTEMNDSTDSSGPSPIAPRLVLALPRNAFAAEVEREFTDNGWEVERAATASEARAMASDLMPVGVVLSAQTVGESGWLTCVKMLCARPELRVVLVAPRAGSSARRFADFVGATAVVAEGEGAAAVARELLGDAVASGC